MQWAGADWIQQAFSVTPSWLGTKVADILGIVYRGIYHINRRSLSKVQWTHPWNMTVSLRADRLATFDFGGLTELVILAHERCVRIDIIGPAGPYGVQLSFSARKRDGAKHERHPTIEQAVDVVRRLAS